MSESTTVRMKLKNHVYFGETEEGVWFDGGERSFLLKDRALYPLVERFVRLLDQGEPVAPALARAPEKLQAFYRKLMASLDEHRMLLRLEPDDDGTPPWTDTPARRELRKLLEDHFEGAALAAKLACWRDARIVVAGQGHALAAAVGALAPCAGRALSVYMQPGAGTRVGEAQIRTAVADDPHAACLLRFVAGEPDAAALDGADLLLYVSDGDDTALARSVDAYLRETGKPGAIAMRLKGQACVLPPVEAGRPGLADLAHWLRDAPEDAESPNLSALAILGCVAAQGALFQLFAIEPEQRRGQVSLVTPELEVQAHPLVSAARSAAPAAPMIHALRHEMPEGRTLAPFERLKLALDPWFDPLCGPFQLAADQALRQMPLLQYPIHVRCARQAGDPQLVVGWGIELGQAGVRALQQAVAQLAAPLVDDPFLIAVEEDEASWRRQALARAIVASGAFHSEHHCAWVALDEVDDPDVAMLVKLLRYHSPQRPRAQLLWSGLGAGCAAHLWLGENPVASAAGSDVLPVLAEALGRACSNFQLEAIMPRYWAQPPRAMPGPSARATVEDWRLALQPAPADPAARLVPLSALGLPPQVYCGIAVLDL